MAGMDSPLRSARLKRGMSLYEAAPLVRLDVSQLSRIERAGRTTRKTAERLADFFGITEEQVLYPERFEGRRPSRKVA
jgi:transcriptional regulator with XRE-family HTH domain